MSECDPPCKECLPSDEEEDDPDTCESCGAEDDINDEDLCGYCEAEGEPDYEAIMENKWSRQRDDFLAKWPI